MRAAGWMVWALLAAGAPEIALAQTTLVEMNDRVGDSIVAESEAARALIAAVKAELSAGTLTLSPEPAETFARAAASWEEVRRLALEREFGPAYKLARKARPDLRVALYDGLGKKPPQAVADAIKAYIEVTEPRLRAIQLQIENYPLTDDGRMNQLLGEAHWAEAQKAAKKKDWSLAFRLVMEAMGELDLALIECYPAAR